MDVAPQGGDAVKSGTQSYREIQRGGADTGIPLVQVEQLKAALEQSRQTAEFKIYPEAPHGFHADYRGSYRKDAAEDDWKQAQAWFRKYGVLSGRRIRKGRPIGRPFHFRGIGIISSLRHSASRPCR